MGALLAVDVGTVRIGVAVSDAGRVLASPLDTVPRADDGSDLAGIAGLAADREVDAVVVGLPIGLSGREGPAAAAVREFAAGLAARLDPVPVVLVDERHTTTSAHRVLREAGHPGRRHRTVVDKAAAAILLQAVLDAGVPGEQGPVAGLGLGERVPLAPERPDGSGR